MGRQIRAAVVVLVMLTVVTGVLYPLAVTGIAQGLFPRAANGSLIVRDGRAVGPTAVHAERVPA